MSLRTAVAHIAQGQSLSGPVFVSSAILAINVPASWIPALLTFQTSYNKGQFYDVYNPAGNELSLELPPGATAGLPEDYLGGGFSIQIRSGLDGFEVPQTAAGGVDITLTLA